MGFPLEWAWSRSGVSKNIRWRTELPEAGNSSPVVWGERVYLTQALDDGRRRTLMCVDRSDGRVLWQEGVVFEGADPRHETNPHCAASPVTDGEVVVVSFASAGIAAYTPQGKRLWLTDLGPQKHSWGQGSSPVIHGESVLVYHGPGKESALYSLEKKTGKVRWQVALPEQQPAERFDGFSGKSDGMLGSFSTPLVVKAGGRDEILMPVANRLQAFGVEDGRKLWWCDGMNPLVYTSASAGESGLWHWEVFLGARSGLLLAGKGM